MKNLENNSKVICKIDTPWVKRGEVVDRFDLEIDRLDYPDVFRALRQSETLKLKYFWGKNKNKL